MHALYQEYIAPGYTYATCMYEYFKIMFFVLFANYSLLRESLRLVSLLASPINQISIFDICHTPNRPPMYGVLHVCVCVCVW